jgi:hypothetical protein
MKTDRHLESLARAGAPVLHVASYEWERVRGLVIGLSGALDRPMKVWSQASGLLVCDENGETQVEDDGETDPLEILRGIHSSEEDDDGSL